MIGIVVATSRSGVLGEGLLLQQGVVGMSVVVNRCEGGRPVCIVVDGTVRVTE